MTVVNNPEGQGNTETTGSEAKTEQVVETRVPETRQVEQKAVAGSKPADDGDGKKAESPAAPVKYSSMLGDKPEDAAADAGDDSAGADGGETAEPEAGELEISLPEGFTLDEEAFGSLKEVAKESGLTKEQAQKLADTHMAAMKRHDEHRIATGLKTIQGWEDEIKAHPEYGGANLDKNLDAARLMLQKYGSPRLKKEFTEMGVLSHPEFAFMLMRMSRDLSEGESVGGESQAMQEKRTADILFDE